MPSTIPGAGTGLFTEINVPKNTIIIPYEGEVITEKEYDRRYPHGGSQYVLDISTTNVSHIIDAVNPHKSNLARYINHSKPFNVEFTKNGNIKSIKKIAAGDELFIDYGSQYFKGRTPPTNAPKKPRVKKPVTEKKGVKKPKATASKKRERALGIY